MGWFAPSRFIFFIFFPGVNLFQDMHPPKKRRISTFRCFFQSSYPWWDENLNSPPPFARDFGHPNARRIFSVRNMGGCIYLPSIFQNGWNLRYILWGMTCKWLGSPPCISHYKASHVSGSLGDFPKKRWLAFGGSKKVEALFMGASPLPKQIL